MNEYLANRSHAVEWSGIRIMFALANEIPGVINLGIGEPDFDTPEFIREAAKKALDEGYTRYPPAKGFSDLRVAIAEKLIDQHPGPVAEVLQKAVEAEDEEVAGKARRLLRRAKNQ